MSSPERGITLVTAPAERRDHIIAMTNVMRTDQQGVGELVILVEDAWQARGLGTALAEHAATVARREGHHAPAAVLAASNGSMLHVLEKLDARPVGATGAVLDLRILLQALAA
ncbi:N-acetyltransferase family protein [Streptomyces sp. NPDC001393]